MSNLPPFSPVLYLGFDYERASRRAQEICIIAGETGQTLRASEHLSALVEIMEHGAKRLAAEAT